MQITPAQQYMTDQIVLAIGYGFESLVVTMIAIAIAYKVFDFIMFYFDVIAPRRQSNKSRSAN